ncbi:hypothetical protein [Microbulbifer sp. VVAC002]|uniref:hypothetical protein n=1 Tax=Microbulbifer sp. VVAC002 TaxID=3243387 RepID=UPI002B30F289|nr:hypothetical protein QT397_14780 [Microbulbifer sp. MKSA007]
MLPNSVDRAVRDNVDKKIVISSAIGAALLGVVTFVAVKTGIKPLAKAAKVAKNGSK